MTVFAEGERTPFVDIARGMEFNLWAVGRRRRDPRVSAVARFVRELCVAESRKACGADYAQPASWYKKRKEVKRMTTVMKDDVVEVTLPSFKHGEIDVPEVVAVVKRNCSNLTNGVQVEPSEKVMQWLCHRVQTTESVGAARKAERPPMLKAYYHKVKQRYIVRKSGKCVEVGEQQSDGESGDGAEDGADDGNMVDDASGSDDVAY